MGAQRIEAFATAAAREAADGPQFLAEVEARAGFPIRLLSGDEEARLSALGVVAGIPDADGLAGDLGGGSLEPLEVRGGGGPGGGGQDGGRRGTVLERVG